MHMLWGTHNTCRSIQLFLARVCHVPVQFSYLCHSPAQKHVAWLTYNIHHPQRLKILLSSPLWFLGCIPFSFFKGQTRSRFGTICMLGISFLFGHSVIITESQVLGQLELPWQNNAIVHCQPHLDLCRYCKIIK